MVGSLRIEAIERFLIKARDLVDVSKITAPPIDPRVLAELQGIKRIVLSKSLQVSGQLICDDNELVIKLNAKEPSERQNFSCCHEIAHSFALDGSRAKARVAAEIFTCSPASSEEYLCDRAAAEMLMPEKFFKPLATGMDPSIASFVALSKTFFSSISATILRLGHLAVWPVVFIVWKFTNHFDSTPKLRVFWSVRPAGYRCYIPRHAPADPASGIHATFLSACPTFENETLNLGSLQGRYLVENGKFGDYVVSIVHDPKLLRGA